MTDKESNPDFFHEKKELKGPDRAIIGFAIFISAILFAVRFGVSDIDFYTGNALSAALFISIIFILGYFYFTKNYDYFIIAWMSFHFAVEMIKIPGLSMSILGIANVIFIPLMILHIVNFKNRHFITILLIILLGLINIGIDNYRIIFSRLFEFISIIVFMGFVIKEVKKPELVLKSIYIIGLLSVPTAIYQAIVHPANGVLVDWRGVRIFGVLFWHNMYSMYLLAPTMIAYYLIRTDYSLARLLLFFLLLLSNVFTLSRQGLLCLGLAIITFELFFRKKKSLTTKRIGIILMLALFIAGYGLYQDRVSDRLSASSISERTNIWNTILPLIEGNFLTGNGLGSYFKYSDLVADGLAPHNQYLLILFEMGILGLCVIVIFLILTINELIKQSKQIKSHAPPLAISIITSLILIAMVGNGFSEISALNGWVAIAALICISKQHTRVNERSHIDNLENKKNQKTESLKLQSKEKIRQAYNEDEKLYK